MKNTILTTQNTDKVKKLQKKKRGSLFPIFLFLCVFCFFAYNLGISTLSPQDIDFESIANYTKKNHKSPFFPYDIYLENTGAHKKVEQKEVLLIQNPDTPALPASPQVVNASEIEYKDEMYLATIANSLFVIADRAFSTEEKLSTHSLPAPDISLSQKDILENIETKIHNAYLASSGFNILGKEKIFTKTIVQGDTVGVILNKWLTQTQILEAIEIASPIHAMTTIHIGKEYRIVLDEQDNFKRFEYEKNNDYIFVLELHKEQVLITDKDTAGSSLADNTEEELIANIVPQEFKEIEVLTARLEPIAYDIELAHVKASIDSSLFDAVVKTGENTSMVTSLVDIFSYQIDFFRSIQKKDSFEVLIEKKYRNSEFKGYGKILAASFTNNGKTYVAYEYTDLEGKSSYYDENGDALERLLLRVPLDFTRVSSGYNLARKHPILGVTRPHQGIDYAAPHGTPVRAVGDGLVTFAGWQNGYGYIVILKHSNGLESQYAHLSKFHSRTKKGSRVEQGDTIAYVGSTGLSTGPHLDFRIRQNGNFVNPDKLIVPKAPPLEGEDKIAFQNAVTMAKSYFEGSSMLADYQPNQEKAEVIIAETKNKS